jgi:SAM-dependent methyltransferase
LANPPAERLATWFAAPAGARLLREEVGPLAEAVRRAHGDTLLWLGCHQAMGEAVRGSMVRRRLYGSSTAGRPVAEIPVLQCAYEALPLPNASLDALVLHHALETAPDPRSVLREAARVVAPGGRLILCAFNPLSLWGMRRLYAGLVPDAFRGLRMPTVFRLLDWLALLGFEIQGAPRYLQFGLPFHRERSREQVKRNPALPESGEPPASVLARAKRWHRLPLGGVCLLAATKQAVAMRPLWRPASRLAPVGYGKPAFGNSKVIRFPLPESRLPAGE